MPLNDRNERETVTPDAGMCELVCETGADPAASRVLPAAPFSAAGFDTAPVCRCGAGPHPELEGRCSAGHVGRGNGLAVVTGQRSVAFWAAEAGARREIARGVIQDSGHVDGDAPTALGIAAEGIAQAVLVRDSAYRRLVESGGPLTASGRARRAFAVWLAASDRLERHLRLVGLERRARHVDPMDAVKAAVREANR